MQREQHLRETGQSTMFDLWGDTAPVPLPELDLAPADVSDREKAVWEKDLMGVSFSEKPFSPVFSSGYGNTVFCGNIDVELDKQVIVTAGRVVSARYSFTKKSESFAIVVLEDVSGQVEVIAWPQVYSQTEEFWQEGNELVVQGKVRVRDDAITVVCDSVSFYEPPQEDKEPAPAPEPVAVEAPVEAVAASAAPEERHRLVINISQTSDEDGDIVRLNKIVAALKVFPGQDEIQLNITNGEEATNLRLANIHTNYCSELHQRLVEMVGEDGFKIETLA
jgi:DNA polymerase III alpha subunit